MKTTSATMPNAVILVMDFTSGRVPDAMDNKLVLATESCIAVGCRSESDGPTELHLARSREIMPHDALVFDGQILTPSKKLSICSIMNEELLSTEVAATTTHVRVFANHPTEPDRILVVFD
jgi:hypothetical protein